MIIKSISDLAVHLGVDVEHLERAVYKYTDCGAWINWDDKKVHVGSIVEGSDAEFSNRFYFPFESSAYDAWMEELERLTSEAWSEANLSDLFEDIVIDPTYVSDYTIEEAQELIDNAKARGWDVPEELTPELYIKMFNDRKEEMSADFIEQECRSRAEDCLCDGIETVDDAREYLHDIKMEGYAVPKELTPELFLKLYKEAN